MPASFISSSTAPASAMFSSASALPLTILTLSSRPGELDRGLAGMDETVEGPAVLEREGREASSDEARDTFAVMGFASLVLVLCRR